MTTTDSPWGRAQSGGPAVAQKCPCSGMSYTPAVLIPTADTWLHIYVKEMLILRILILLMKWVYNTPRLKQETGAK